MADEKGTDWVAGAARRDTRRLEELQHLWILAGRRQQRLGRALAVLLMAAAAATALATVLGGARTAATVLALSTAALAACRAIADHPERATFCFRAAERFGELAGRMRTLGAGSGNSADAQREWLRLNSEAGDVTLLLPAPMWAGRPARTWAVLPAWDAGAGAPP